MSPNSEFSSWLTVRAKRSEDVGKPPMSSSMLISGSPLLLPNTQES